MSTDQVSDKIKVITDYLRYTEIPSLDQLTVLFLQIPDIQFAISEIEQSRSGKKVDEMEVVLLDSAKFALEDAINELAEKIRIYSEIQFIENSVNSLYPNLNDPYADASAPCCSRESPFVMSATPTRQPASHPLEFTYFPKSSVVAENKFNQKIAGYPNGCTHFSLHFFDVPKCMDYTPESLEQLFHDGKFFGIIPGVNGYAKDLLERTGHFQMADIMGNPTDESTIVIFNADEVKESALSEMVDAMIVSMDTLEGFIITTGLETFAVRFRSEGDVEFFDPHGNSEQSEAAFIFTFDHSKAAEQITKIIFDRARHIIAQTSQVEIFPILLV